MYNNKQEGKIILKTYPKMSHVVVYFITGVIPLKEYLLLVSTIHDKIHPVIYDQ